MRFPNCDSSNSRGAGSRYWLSSFAFVLARRNIQPPQPAVIVGSDRRVAFIAIAATAVTIVRDAYWDDQDVPSIAAAIASRRGYEGTDEYAPIGLTRLDLPGNPDDTERPAGISSNPAPRFEELDLPPMLLEPVARIRLHVERWTAEAQGVHRGERHACHLRVATCGLSLVGISGRCQPRRRHRTPSDIANTFAFSHGESSC